MYDAFLYIIANEGIDTESTYKYQGQVRFRACVGPHVLIVTMILSIYTAISL